MSSGKKSRLEKNVRWTIFQWSKIFGFVNWILFLLHVAACAATSISGGVLNFVVVQDGNFDRLPDFDGSVLTGEEEDVLRKAGKFFVSWC